MAENEEELKSGLMKMKEIKRQTGLKSVGLKESDFMDLIHVKYSTWCILIKKEKILLSNMI